MDIFVYIKKVYQQYDHLKTEDFEVQHIAGSDDCSTGRSKEYQNRPYGNKFGQQRRLG